MSIDTRRAETPQLSVNSGSLTKASLPRNLPVDTSLQKCLEEFDSFLSGHGERIAELRQRLLAAPYEDYDPYSDNSARALDFTDTSNLRELDEHSHNLATFIEAHLANLHRLQCSLRAEDSSKLDVVEVHRPLTTPKSEDLSSAEVKELSQQFSIIVVFSTFTAGLIIAYLQLMGDILPPPDPVNHAKLATHWYMGFGFGLTGVIWNVAIAIVAGADTAACASGRPWMGVREIRGRFLAFAFAQFIGAIMFGGCIGLLLYPFHEGQVMVILPMIIFPLAVLRAGTDLASMSKEFREMKADFKNWFCGCCRRR